jgi:RNA polymerase sigma-70 factor (ECF subfamily)
MNSALNPALNPAMPAAPPIGWHELAPLRAGRVGDARRRRLDPALAEDLVHDVFEAVMSGRAVFGGRSALRSWLVGILKHKIVDLVRQRSGHDSLDAYDDDPEAEHAGRRQFASPAPQPDEVAEQRQRLALTLARIQALPATLRHAVELRLLRDESTEEVCRTLAISEQNLFVRLHRARRALAC